ncbi:hypothetical protein UO65_4378 [Actinokineospora spheciospongiae]|uniref:Low molecular weight protein antigen 6 PH domain-containing protein n=1 Tax=Actinokineospora spheciospongiae TaxID=909613 RepID=W7IHA0_9PSEU|nr:PH domain-containing protein [Actinokineospora spheciospongiae]EWC60270.1 hypothetical protein UO65_4378 [Actinokineospora spheciospongiae]PWW52724.1 PH (Pleckstrin Homology) domain-containing protein [Actinokineospora spheciospongiae]
MRDGEVITVVRRKLEHRFAIACVIGTAAGTLWLAVNPPEGVGFSYMAQATLVLSLACWGMWLAAGQSRVVVRSTGLEVVNMALRHRIPWAAVIAVVAKEDVLIHVRGSANVRPAAAGWSIAGNLRGNPQQRLLAREIEAAQRAGDPTDLAVTRSVELTPLPFLALYAAALLVCWFST